MLQISQLLSSGICPYVLSEQDGDENYVWFPIKFWERSKVIHYYSN